MKNAKWRTGYSAVLMLSALLGGATLVFCSQLFKYQIGACLILLPVLFIGWRVINGSRPIWFAFLVFLSTILMIAYVLHLMNSNPPFPFRLLQIAAALCYGAVLLSTFIGIIHPAGMGTALVFSLSIAISLFLCEMLLPYLSLTSSRLLQAGGVPRWVGGAVPHPSIGFHNQPNSTAWSYYPDNPRGYFEQTDPIRDSWRLETHEGSEAQLEPPKIERGVMRVSISKSAKKVPWHVQLQQRPLQLKGGESYILSFRARANRTGSIAAAVGQGHPPWGGLGLYRELKIDPEWKSFKYTFIATETDPNARIHFDIGAKEATVEVADIILRHSTSQEKLMPDLKREFFVSYKFNSLGCRGPDYPMPRPSGTFRILALGDSYTLGVGVHEQDTFTVRLQRLLNNNKYKKQNQGIRTFEVINGGVSGYSTRDERLSYEFKYSRYSPQVVLLMMVFNDDLSGPDEAKIINYTPISKYENLSSIWMFIQALRHRRPPHDYSVCVNELIKLNETCKGKGSKLYAVVFRNGRYFNAFDQLLEAVQEGTKGTGIAVLDLGPALFKTHNDEDLKVHKYDGHPNENAHVIAAEVLFRFLKAQNVLP